MRVFKFGGASIRTAEAIRNLYNIISGYRDDNWVLVVSAMGKTTNHLERIINYRTEGKNTDILYQEIYEYHVNILNELITDSIMRDHVNSLFIKLKNRLQDQNPIENRDMFYDEIVSYGEIFSSTIISQFLSLSGIEVAWKDAREFIRTDNSFREGQVDWKTTCSLINNDLKETLDKHNIVTQGFIAGTESGHTTTLGREGSDYTAAIIASCLDAESVTIWKDVPGILNADPKKFRNTRLFPNLSYYEAAELTYYGAKVIHPKTIKPLANKNIPLFVKSFEKPALPGTLIDYGRDHDIYPSFILKENQCLITFRAKDLAFINENNLSIIFHILDMLNIKMNLMQNSAVSFTICMDYHAGKLKKLLDALKNDFDILYNEPLELFTVKNYTVEAIEEVSKGKNVLVEQRTRNTFQIVVKS